MSCIKKAAVSMTFALVLLAATASPAFAATIIGESEGAMSPNRTSVSYGACVTETALGDFVADAMRNAAAVDIAIELGGNFAKSLPGGEITADDARAVFASDEQVVTVTLTMPELFAVMEQAVGGTSIDEAEKIDPESGSAEFPQVSGFSFTYDVSQREGKRIRKIVLDSGEKLEEDGAQTVTAALPVNMISGDEKFSVLEDAEYIEAGSESDTLIGYISGFSGVIERPALGRMSVIGTADSSIYNNWHIGAYLPYIILIVLIFTLPAKLRKKTSDNG